MEDNEGIDKEMVDFVIQESLQESCRFPTATDGEEAVSDDYRRIVAAVERGDARAVRELWGRRPAFREVDARGRLLLHRAAALPRAPVLDQVLLASGELTPEAATADGETALTLAAAAGLEDNVLVLLQHGASPHNANAKNESPLLLAVRRGSYAAVDALLSGGADAGQVCLRKWTATHEAAKTGAADILSLLLSRGGGGATAQVAARDGHSVTPLGVAAEYGHARALDVLVRHGGDVNAQAANGDTVLYDAAGSGSLDCVELLLRHGANPNVASLACQLPIHRAAYDGHYPALAALIPVTAKRAVRLSGQSPVHSAADGGQAACLSLLIDHGFDVDSPLGDHIAENYRDGRRSALYFAVSNGHAACAETLLAAGAAADRDPLPCLLVAVRAGRYELVRLLLSRGAEVNCYFRTLGDTAYPTALQYCLRDAAMLRLLLNNGYDAEKCFRCDHGDGRRRGDDDDSDAVSFCGLLSLASLAGLAAGVVRTLLDYVGGVSLCPALRRLLEGRGEEPEILGILGNPRTLQHLCRLAIRRRVTRGRLSDPVVMATAPFPPALKSYLTYREYDLCGGTSGTEWLN